MCRYSSRIHIISSRHKERLTFLYVFISCLTSLIDSITIYTKVELPLETAYIGGHSLTINIRHLVLNALLIKLGYYVRVEVLAIYRDRMR